MTRPDNISDNDRKLAEELRNRLEGNPSSDTGNMNDPLMQSLINFKESEVAESSVDLSSGKEKSWNVIKQTIEQSENSTRKESRLYKLAGIKHLGKIAAVITISVLLSIYYFQTPSSLQPLAVADDTIESVTLTDGSIVTLRPNSALFEKQTEDRSHTYYLEGEAYFDVVKHENRTFTVQTESGIVEVLGTEFNIRTWNNATDVFLVTGSLRFSSASDSENNVLLSPGQFSSLNNNQIMLDQSISDEKLITSWKNNEIIFTNRTAESIFSELEHHYSITIVAPDNINAEILGGSLSLDNPGQSLKNLGTVLDGTFVQSGVNTYKFVSSE